MSSSQQVYIQGHTAGRRSGILDVLAHLNNRLATLTEAQQKLRAPVGGNPYTAEPFPVEGFNYAADEHLGGEIEQVQDLIGEISEMLNEEPIHEFIGHVFEVAFEKLYMHALERNLKPYHCYMDIDVCSTFIKTVILEGIFLHAVTAQEFSYKGVTVHGANYQGIVIGVMTATSNDDRIYTFRLELDWTVTGNDK